MGESSMEPVIQKFRGAVLGGFNRRDVLNYIEQINKNINSKP